MGGLSKGRIIAVNGPLATCEVDQGHEVLQNEVAYVNCQGASLKAEVIRIRGRQIDMQVFESTTGMVVGDEVEFLRRAAFGDPGAGHPGHDLRRPAESADAAGKRTGLFPQAGSVSKGPGRGKDSGNLRPAVAAGAIVKAGQYLGSVPEGLFKHHTIVPLEFAAGHGKSRRSCRRAPTG